MDDWIPWLDSLSQGGDDWLVSHGNCEGVLGDVCG